MGGIRAARAAIIAVTVLALAAVAVAPSLAGAPAAAPSLNRGDKVTRQTITTGSGAFIAIRGQTEVGANVAGTRRLALYVYVNLPTDPAKRAALARGGWTVWFDHDRGNVTGLLGHVDLSTNVGGVISSTSGEAGVVPIPFIGWVHHLEDSPATIGLGLYGIAGFRNNMPADRAIPILGAGPLFADAEILQIAPTFSYALTERLSVGAAPTITAARIMFDPLGPVSGGEIREGFRAISARAG